MSQRNVEPESVTTPATSPFCGSSKIAAATEKVDTSTYWRCTGCGEMWNLGRLRTTSNRYGGRPRWQ